MRLSELWLDRPENKNHSQEKVVYINIHPIDKDLVIIFR